MSTVRIAIIGAGLIGRRHLAYINENPRCAVAAIVDPSPAGEAMAKEHGVPYFRSLSELLQQAPPHAAIIATPNRLHVEQALECLESGVPVLVEKPVADSIDDALTLADAAETSGVPVLVGHHRRHSPALRAAQEIIASGQLGRLVAFSGMALYRKPDVYFAEATWRTTEGGGPVLINLIHEIDALRMLCGEIAEVSAVASNAMRGFEVEDTVSLAIRFTNGALGTFLLSDTASSVRSWENLSGEDPAFPRYEGADCYVVSGMNGSLEIPTMRLRQAGVEPSWWHQMTEHRISIPEGDPLALQLDHFCDVVQHGASPRVTVRDAAQSLQVVLEVARTMRDSLAA